ncbi:MAG: Phosphoribosylglycinamide formyltransferase [Bacteroidota bacterium]|jgi:phosphoribosylglycinamide formyltransferase-1
MKKILIFASGSGSNAENVARFFEKSNTVSVVAIATNNSSAKVIDRAKNLSIPLFLFDKNQLFNGDVLDYVNEIKPDLILLAGFLLQFPKSIIAKYPNKIINLHPALLPKYGGRGMYGTNVHKAVLENKEKETGITIHYVNEHYDEGKIIVQKTVNIESCSTAEEIAAKIHDLEMKHLPETIQNLLT